MTGEYGDGMSGHGAKQPLAAMSALAGEIADLRGTERELRTALTASQAQVQALEQERDRLNKWALDHEDQWNHYRATIASLEQRLAVAEAMAELADEVNRRIHSCEGATARFADDYRKAFNDLLTWLRNDYVARYDSLSQSREEKT